MGVKEEIGKFVDELFREYEVKTGHTAADIARASGVKESTLSKWRNGEVGEPRWEKCNPVAEIICPVLGLDIRAFWEGIMDIRKRWGNENHDAVEEVRETISSMQEDLDRLKKMVEVRCPLQVVDYPADQSDECKSCKHNPDNELNEQGD